jgi:hypothetical protein
MPGPPLSQSGHLCAPVPATGGQHPRKPCRPSWPHACRRRLNTDPLSTGRFPLTVATLSLIIRGRVVVSSGEEGARAASAVGQAPAVRRAAGARVEHRCRGAGGRGVAVGRGELVARLQDLPPRPGHRVRPAARAAGGAGDQLQVPVAGRADRDRGPAPLRNEHAAGRRPAGPGAIDDLKGAAPQHIRQRRVPAVRGSPAGHRPARPPAPPAHRDKH